MEKIMDLTTKFLSPRITRRAQDLASGSTTALTARFSKLPLDI
jgi:hypothetical protein